MVKKIVLNAGFAVWIGDVVVANVCASRLSGFRCRINGDKTNHLTLVLKDIERGGWFAIGFFDIEKVGSGHCLLNPSFEVGTIDPGFGIQMWN